MRGQKWCQAGKHFVDRTNFNKDRKTRDGLHCWCRECHNAHKRARYDTESNYRRFLKSRYGLEPERYDAMLEEQDRCCAICGALGEEGRRLHVDHCHDSGHVRALLCGSCNNGLGHFRDSADLLEEAVAYLKDFGVLKAEVV